MRRQQKKAGEERKARRLNDYQGIKCGNPDPDTGHLPEVTGEAGAGRRVQSDRQSRADRNKDSPHQLRDNVPRKMPCSGKEVDAHYTIRLCGAIQEAVVMGRQYPQSNQMNSSRAVVKHYREALPLCRESEPPADVNCAVISLWGNSVHQPGDITCSKYVHGYYEAIGHLTAVAGAAYKLRRGVPSSRTSVSFHLIR
ncbi:hypothetical protein J6590_053114 [Homalodisca vitripennis]|nr:hypothetical protein J6590_053114 [Homalodisca vitripennis]